MTFRVLSRSFSLWQLDISLVVCWYHKSTVKAGQTNRQTAPPTSQTDNVWRSHCLPDCDDKRLDFYIQSIIWCLHTFAKSAGRSHRTFFFIAYVLNSYEIGKKPKGITITFRHNGHLHLSLTLSLNMWVRMCVYVFVCVCMCVCSLSFRYHFQRKAKRDTSISVILSLDVCEKMCVYVCMSIKVIIAFQISFPVQSQIYSICRLSNHQWSCE